MQQSESIKEIAAALAKAQGAMAPAAKDSENPHFKSKYADLASIWDAIRKPLTDNGLSILQNVITVEKGIAVETQINHSSGEWFRLDQCIIPVDRNSAQGVGSAVTYGKRYSLSAAVGVACDLDDDGNAATDAPPKQQANREKPPFQTSKPQAKPQPAKTEDKPALSQKDSLTVARIVQMFSETQSNQDFVAICTMLKEPDSIVNKAEDSAGVRAAVMAAIKGHKHSKPPEQPVEQVEEYAS